MDQDFLSKKDQASDNNDDDHVDHNNDNNEGGRVKKKSRRTYKINIDEVKFRFLSELIYLFYFEIKQKFPDSFKIQLLSNYYALKFKKMEMLCIF